MSRQRQVQTDLETGQLLSVAEGCEDGEPVTAYDQAGNAYRLFEARNEGGRLVLIMDGPQSWGEAK